MQVGKNVEDLFASGKLPTTLAIGQIDWDSCFGTFEQAFIRECVREELPEHKASICWKHSNASYDIYHVRQGQPGVFVEHRDAEQGNGAAFEAGLCCSVATRGTMYDLHNRQTTGRIPWSELDAQMVSDESSHIDPQPFFNEVLADLNAWLQAGPGGRVRENGSRIPHPSTKTQVGGGAVHVPYP